MYSIGAISKPNNFVEPRFGAKASQLRPVSADVNGEHLLGEDVTVAVSTEDSYRNFGFLTGLAAFAHLFEQPPSLMYKVEKSEESIRFQ
jgi:hypothetical protein